MMRLLISVLLLLGTAACTASEAAPRNSRPIKSKQPSFSIADATVGEAGSIVTLTITKSGSSNSASSVVISTRDGTAVAGTDYVTLNQTVTIGATQSTAQISIPIIDDSTHENSETFTVNMVAGSNARISDGSATVTIVDNDAAPSPPPPPPSTQTCPDGTVIPISSTCPTTPTGGWISSPSLTGLTTIASGFDPSLSLSASTVPGPDVGEGAFRFLCGAGQLLYDDPLLFPGQPGASHLHQFYGNKLANANSTFNSLRTSGGTTCGNDTYPVNRSAYWQPAMLDGKGHVVQPDYSVIYYKHPPLSKMTGWKTAPDPSQSEGIKAKLPNGIRFIFGWDPTGQHPSPTGAAYYYCSVGDTNVHYADIPHVAAACHAVGDQIIYALEAPSCWDGTHLDSPDHRSHVAYADYSNGWGYLQCPQAFPYVIPAFTLKTFYSVAVGDDPSLWSLSSDAMAPTKPHGYTIHGDFWMAWDDTIHQIWENNCLDLELNCSAGQTGEGHAITNMDHPVYGWTNPDHLVPIP